MRPILKLVKINNINYNLAQSNLFSGSFPETNLLIISSFNIFSFILYLFLIKNNK